MPAQHEVDLGDGVHEVDVRWDVRIRARDGISLSANVWLPRPRPDAPDERFPAILEMIPYGKDSWRRNADTARGEADRPAAEAGAPFARSEAWRAQVLQRAPRDFRLAVSLAEQDAAPEAPSDEPRAPPRQPG